MKKLGKIGEQIGKKLVKLVKTLVKHFTKLPVVGKFWTILDHIRPILTNLDHSFNLDLSILTRLFRHVYLDMSILTCLF